MNNYYKDTVQILELELQHLAYETDNLLIVYEKSIMLIINKLVSLKNFVIDKDFKDLEEEILFFKELKPNIVSRLIYYNSIYKIEAKKPQAGKIVLESYYNNEVLELKRFYDKNLDFFKYYRTNSSHLDHKYFLRGKHDIKLSLDTYYFESDHSFSTSHDYKVAKILASDLIHTYIEQQIENLHTEKESLSNSKSLQVNWTSTKTDLIELIYALHSHSSLNNGNIDIKSIATFFSHTFNIDLGDYYHAFSELRNRKKTSTKFLDKLRESLLKKIDDLDEKQF